MTTPLPRSIRRLTRGPDAGRLRLVCFPFAGAGAYSYRNWANDLPDDVELFAVQLPGREDRIREEPDVDLERVVARLADDLLPILDRPYALFGHSLGAIIGAEVGRQLDGRGAAPARLFVSGCRALPVVHVDREPVHLLRDDELVEHIRRLNGTPEELLQDATMMAFVVRLVRADYALLHAYAYAPSPTLACPITVLGGDRDPTTPLDSLEPWAELTSGDTTIHIVGGDHFFVTTARDEVVARVVQDLADVRGTSMA